MHETPVDGCSNPAAEDAGIVEAASQTEPQAGTPGFELGMGEPPEETQQAIEDKTQEEFTPITLPSVTGAPEEAGCPFPHAQITPSLAPDTEHVTDSESVDDDHPAPLATAASRFVLTATNGEDGLDVQIPEEPLEEEMPQTDTGSSGGGAGKPPLPPVSDSGGEEDDSRDNPREASLETTKSQDGWPDDPADHKELTRASWVYHKEEFKALHDLMNGATDIVLARAKERTEGEFDLREATAHYKPAIVPGDPVITLLPPNTFGPVTESPTPPAVIPESQDEREEISEKYTQYVFANCPENTNVTLTLPETLEDFEGKPIDPEKWQAYTDAAREQLNQGQQCTLDLLAHMRYGTTQSVRAGNLIRDLRDTIGCEPAESLAVLLAQKGPIMEPRLSECVVLPVSEYGEEFTEKLIRSAGFLQDTAGDYTIQLELSAKSKENAELITNSTVMGLGFSPHGALCETLSVGNLSVIQTMAFLTSHRVEGFETGEELLKAIVKDGLVEKFVRNVPTGFIAGMSNSGYVCPGLVKRAESGNQATVQYDPDKLTIMKSAEEMQSHYMAKRWREYVRMPDSEKIRSNRPAVFGLACPAIRSVTQTCRLVVDKLID